MFFLFNAKGEINKMKKNRLWIVLLVLLMAALACVAGPAATATSTPVVSDAVPTEATTTETETETEEETEQPAPTADAGSGNTNKTEFPLPENVSNFMDMGDSAINFQTSVSLKDVLAFYQDALSKEGYTERTILTVTTDTTFNLVFDGHKSGKAIVIQGVDLGNGSSNVNIRLEAINN